MDRESNNKTLKYGIVLSVDLKKDLEQIAESEGHSTLSSFIRKELINIRDQKMKNLKKEGEGDV